MADWVDNYDGFGLDAAEIERLFRLYEMGSSSKKYLLSLFRVREEDFDRLDETLLQGIVDG